MSGKRAKPSPWRFLRAAPVVVIAVVVWVLVGFFLLPGSGSDQAHEWGVDPTPSSSGDEERVAGTPSRPTHLNRPRPARRPRLTRRRTRMAPPPRSRRPRRTSR